MIKKIYSIVASLLLLTACSTDDWMPGQSGAELNVKFSVDVPSAAVITKSTSVPTNETGIENLNLVTFDGSNNYIATVAATNVSGNAYTAVISKDTRRIQFVANYDDVASIQTTSAASTTATDNYSFFADKTITAGTTDLGNIEMLRNWSKITVTDNSGKLSDVSFMVYNASTKATLAPGEGTTNIPSGNTLSKAQSFVSVVNPIHTFEQTTSGSTPAFVIIKAKFNGASDYSYYKLDLSVTDATTGTIHNYDIMRNYWFKIDIKSVQRKGVSWDEVTKEGKVADNNITASTELDKYPKITFDGETLEVSKTTYVFTKSGESLSMLATYSKGDAPDYSKLLLDQSGTISNVVSGSISMEAEGTSGRITAAIKAPSATEQVAYFYVRGGNLQRKITLILRQPYTFTDAHFYKELRPSAAEPYTEGTTNKVAAIQGEDIYLGFTIPDATDESLFPMEIKIKSSTLYSVEDGVRIETTGTGTYYYIYTAKESGFQTVHFKTNSSGSGETVTLSNDYFADATAKYVTEAPSKLSGIAQYGATGASTFSNINGTVSYSIGGGTSQSMTVSNGAYSGVTLSNSIADNAAVTFTYTNGGFTYTLTTTIGEWKAKKNLVLTANVLSGVAQYYNKKWRTSGNITWKTTSNSGTITIKNGTYTIPVPLLSDNDLVTFTYKNNGVTYTNSMTFAQWKDNRNLYLYSGNIKGKIQTGAYSDILGFWIGTDVPSGAIVACSLGTIKVTSAGNYQYIPPITKLNSDVIVTYGSYSATIAYDDLLDGYRIRLQQ
jgi:hypothetical protein